MNNFKKKYVGIEISIKQLLHAKNICASEENKDIIRDPYDGSNGDGWWL